MFVKLEAASMLGPENSTPYGLRILVYLEAAGIPDP
jgi:hypothetical protein